VIPEKAELSARRGRKAADLPAKEMAELPKERQPGRVFSGQARPRKGGMP